MCKPNREISLFTICEFPATLLLLIINTSISLLATISYSGTMRKLSCAGGHAFNTIKNHYYHDVIRRYADSKSFAGNLTRRHTKTPVACTYAPTLYYLQLYIGVFRSKDFEGDVQQPCRVNYIILKGCRERVSYRYCSRSAQFSWQK